MIGAVSPWLECRYLPRVRPRPFSLLTALTLTVCSSGAPAETDAASASAGTTAVSWDSSSGDTGSTGAPTTDAPSTATSADASSSDSSSSSGDGTTGEPPLPDDEALLRKAIAGEVDPQEAMATIAGRGGLPVATADGDFLFACLCGQGEWNLVGDHNGWVDAPMAASGPLWWAEAEIPAPDGSLYKFREAGADLYVADPLGRRYDFDENGRYTLVRASAPHLERWFGLGGGDLSPRDLQVYVPADGVFTHTLYAHDGKNLFDPEAPFGYWKLQETVPPKMLVVGVDQTDGRHHEYTHVPDIVEVFGPGEVGGLGEAYADFIDGVVRPRMEAAYGPAEVVGTMGSSLGGLIALVIADRFPDRYDMAISMSGTVGWGSISLHNQTIIERYAAAGKRDFAIYVDSGGAGTCGDADQDGVDDDDPKANDNFCENAQLHAVLTDLGYDEGVDLWYEYAPGAPHSEAAWAARVDVPLAAFAAL